MLCLRDLRPRFGRLHLQRHTRINGISGFHSSQFDRANLRINRVTASLRCQNGVKQLLHFECDLIRRAARVGPCTRGIGASRIHPSASAEIMRDRLRQSGCAQEEVRVALRKRHRGARQRPGLRVYAEGALRDLDPLLIANMHGA